jgi:hypothetical protein
VLLLVLLVLLVVLEMVLVPLNLPHLYRRRLLVRRW